LPKENNRQVWVIISTKTDRRCENELNIHGHGVCGNIFNGRRKWIWAAYIYFSCQITNYSFT